MRTLLPFLVACSTASDVLDTADELPPLEDAITEAALMDHLAELQAIADVHEGNRAVGTSGYAASVDYAESVLVGAGYRVERVPFDVSVWRLTAATVLESGAVSYESGVDVATLSYSASGDVTAAVRGIDLVLPPTASPSSTSGCEASDFADLVAGEVALIQRGSCTFQQKAELAEAAGAGAVIVFNEGQPDRTDLEGWQLDPEGVVGIPVVGVSFAVGEELAASVAPVRVVVSAQRFVGQSENVIAETPGDDTEVVVVGGHLDSVPEGPGINDNGTGVALILELARAMAARPDPDRQVRFALWGAEEIGLVGSTSYVESLGSDELGTLAANLNFDMIGSPNGARFIYDGDGSDYGRRGPGASDDIEEVFEDFFAEEGLDAITTPFDGRSDYGGFIERGIAAGGLFSGAESTKSAELADRFGGEAGVAFDACYHRACDDIGNIDPVLFLELSRASARATEAVSEATFDVGLGGARAAVPELSIGTCGDHGRHAE